MKHAYIAKRFVIRCLFAAACCNCCIIIKYSIFRDVLHFQWIWIGIVAQPSRQQKMSGVILLV